MELQLILEVEKRRMLYDKDLNVYKKQNVRDEAWKEVAAILNLTESECRKKWRGLRDQFIKIYRSEQVTGTSKRKTPWIYYNQMLFLIPHIGLKESCGFWRNAAAVAAQVPSAASDSGVEEETKPFCIAVSPKSLSNDDQEDSCPRQYKRKYWESDEERTNDPDEQFLLSYLPTLKRFTPRQNALARMRIQQVLYGIEFGGEDNQEDTSYNVYISSQTNECFKNE